MSKEQVYKFIARTGRPEVYGYAYHNYDRIMQDGKVNMMELAITICHALKSNAFFKVESDHNVMNEICHMFYVDPMLMRVYMG